MRCVYGCAIRPNDEDAVQMDKGMLCGRHVEDLLGKAPEPSTDKIGRVITNRKQPKMRAAFSDSLGAFAPRRRI